MRGVKSRKRLGWPREKLEIFPDCQLNLCNGSVEDSPSHLIVCNCWTITEQRQDRGDGGEREREEYISKWCSVLSQSPAQTEQTGISSMEDDGDNHNHKICKIQFIFMASKGKYLMKTIA